jgi:hypothetical protein
LLLVLPAFLPAQTAAELEALLESPVVSVAQAARFVLEAAGTSSFLVNAEKESFDLAKHLGWVPKAASPDDPVTMRDLSRMIMAAFDLEGGILYSLRPSARYAYREMVYQQYIQGNTDPQFTISGERLLRVLGRVLSRSGEDGRLAEEMAGSGVDPQVGLADLTDLGGAGLGGEPGFED